VLYKIPLLLTPQPEGGFTVTSPLLPELITEGESVDEVLINVRDAFAALLEVYEDLGKQLPHNLQFVDQSSPALIETIISA
jgi:antitoxin HicB